MKDTIQIRKFTATDLDTLRHITVASFGGVALEQTLEERLGIWDQSRDWKARKADHIDEDCRANPDGIFVAELNGEIVGYITTRVDLINSRGRIPNMAVTEAARGMGLGRRLIHHALDYFREEGLKVAQIETMASNAIGQHLYPSCGFQEMERQVHYAMRL
ncbi:MAG: GNAT family N-acetyltransferase [Verrucomicrobiales bacterium]|nr:GNAT family N-acetyltransferase [Verrucomicrobiales bacterium]MCP5557145.1 GNAT family N-acetyltransferase [Verrucomicrobiaceae bacterium]